MKTVVLNATDPEAIESAAALLRDGQLVALPTETVYGLAGNALQTAAVREIFAVKDRPLFDPLIVHVREGEQVRQLASPPLSSIPLLDQLTEEFWPGPLTILAPRTGLVPDIVTAGRPLVALRMPSHAVFRQVLQSFGGPLAAPSANRFGRVSPTTAAHVERELGGRIPLILDAGPTSFGLESTIVRLTSEYIELLRPGPITREDLEQYGPVKDRTASAKVQAPGQMPSHYAPEHPVRILRRGESPGKEERAGLICWGPPALRRDYVRVRSLSEKYDLAEAAARLFAVLREMDSADLDTIYVEPLPECGIGAAVMNRLHRAAAATPREQTQRT